MIGRTKFNSSFTVTATNVLLIRIKHSLLHKQLQKPSLPENLRHMNFDTCAKTVHGCNIETTRTSQVFSTSN